jgi:hypothetical protein
MEKVLIPKIYNSSKSKETKKVSIAYLILVHRFPEQFKRLFNAIYDSNNCYLIHLDKKVDFEFHNDVQKFLNGFENCYILESENVVWGGYSMVNVELRGMKYLLNINVKWDFFINLSGQDFPLKSQEIICDFLTQQKGKSFLKVANQFLERPDTMNRIENYFIETDTGFSETSQKRNFLENVVSYIGGQWMILTRDCCEFICNSGESQKFEDYYKNTLIADESFFQTLLMNSSFNGEIVSNDMRAIIWIPDGNIKLRPKTFTTEDIDFLLLGDNLFARKFDDNIDSDIINILQESFY